jgi:four helix bundle protein
MTPAELQSRFKQYALRCVKLQKSLPKELVADVISSQLIRSAFSAAANYRAACNAQSKKAFISKLSISYEEVDETVFWLEMIAETNLLPSQKLSLIIEEGRELAKILGASRITSRKTEK